MRQCEFIGLHGGTASRVVNCYALGKLQSKRRTEFTTHQDAA